jgi:hypothetical protein
MSIGADGEFSCLFLPLQERYNRALGNSLPGEIGLQETSEFGVPFAG